MMARVMDRLALLALGAIACSGCSNPTANGADAAIDQASAPLDATALVDAAGGGACGFGLAAPADRVRRVIVSHPFDAVGMPASGYEVLALAADGTLSSTGARFTLGRATAGAIRFTPDGSVAFVAQDDGSIGVVRFDASGAPVVVQAAFTGAVAGDADAGTANAWDASALLVAPTGDRLFVLDANWRENGGGIYGARIACDGSLTDEGLLAPAKLPWAADWVPSSGAPPRAVLAAKDVLASPAGAEAHLVALPPSGAPSLLGSATVFGDDQEIVSSVAVTADGRYALIADNDAFSSVPNRVAIAAILDGGLAKAQTIAPLVDPVAVATSPFGDAALVASGMGNALLALGYDPSASPPFTLRGPLAYRGAKPQLPSAMVGIARGALAGRVLVAENLGVRQVAFRKGGAVDDLGLFTTGADSSAIVGAIGVQP